MAECGAVREVRVALLTLEFLLLDVFELLVYVLHLVFEDFVLDLELLLVYFTALEKHLDLIDLGLRLSFKLENLEFHEIHLLLFNGAQV